MICWQAVNTDCAGHPDLVTRYRQESAYIRVVGTQPCGDGTDSTCPVYLRENFLLSQDNSGLCWPNLPDPNPGEVLLNRVTAIDDAGFEDCGGT